MANKFDDLLEQFGSNAETLNETVLVDKRYLEEQKRKAKAFNEIVLFVREQYVRANQNYGFAKYYGKSNEELKQAEEELLKIQKVAKEVCNVLGITLEEFIILEDK